MNGLIATVLCWLGVLLDNSVSSGWRIGLATPNFGIIFFGIGCLFLSVKGSTALGLWSGLLIGAVSGANLFAYVFSRSIAGFASYLARLSGIQFVPISAGIFVLIFTVFIQILTMFVAPPPAIAQFLLATIVSAIYNGVLAAPLFALLSRVFQPSSLR